MFISKLSIKNFGSFESADFSFSAMGINVIHGANETGKTQIIGAILAAVMGRRAIKIDKKGIGPATVRVSIAEGNATEEISLVVSINQQGEPVVEQSTQPPTSSRHPGPLRLRLLTAVSSATAPHLFLPGTPRPNTLSARTVDAVGRLLPDQLKKHRTWLSLRASGELENPHRPGGVASLGVLLEELLERRRTSTGLPLIVDEFLWKLSDAHVVFAIGLLESIAETAQVLVLANRSGTFSGARITFLDDSRQRTHSLAYYNRLYRPKLSIFRTQTLSALEPVGFHRSDS